MIRQKWIRSILVAATALIALSAFGDERSFLKTDSGPYGSDTFYNRHVSREQLRSVTIDGYFEGFSSGNRMVVRLQSGQQAVLRAPRGLKVYNDSGVGYGSQRQVYGNRRYDYRVPQLRAIDLRRGDYIRVDAIPVGRSGLEVRSISLMSSNNQYYRQQQQRDQYYRQQQQRDQYYRQQRQYDQQNQMRRDDNWRRRADDQRYRNEERRANRDNGDDREGDDDNDD